MGQEHTGDCSKHRHEQSFCEHLANEPPAGGAERAANGKLLGPQRRPAKLHVHHVHACNQQDENDRSEHRPNGLAQLWSSESVEKGLDAGRDKRAVGFRILLRETAGEADKLGVCLVNADTVLEPAHDRRPYRVALEIAARFGRKFVEQRHPKLLANRKSKVGRHDPNDGGGLAVNPNVLANDVAIAAEIALPNFVT